MITVLSRELGTAFYAVAVTYVVSVVLSCLVMLERARRHKDVVLAEAAGWVVAALVLPLAWAVAVVMALWRGRKAVVVMRRRRKSA